MKTNFINVIPATSLSRSAAPRFTYRLPAELSRPAVGSLVEVPFGKKNIPAVVSGVDIEETLHDVKLIVKILDPEPLFTPELFELAEKLSRHYLVPLTLMVKAMLSKVAPRARLRPESVLGQNSHSKDLILNAGQTHAVKTLLSSSDEAGIFLLHGVTGSGKTEVYLRVIEQLVKSGRQALVLVPEISLTPQTLRRFAERFPKLKVAVVHSKISYGQKSAIWKGVRSGAINILIGPRSAVFAPFQKLGFIVIDEEHDPSYKQSDQNPKFDARTACEMLSRIWGCLLVMGDATPSLETYHRAVTGKISLLSLPDRVGQALPQVKLIDMQSEARAGRFDVLSEPLKLAIDKTLQQKKQIILFINRRGTATSLACRDCGKPVLCDRCDSPLVYHQIRKQLVCHHCDRTFPLPANCPACKSQRLKFFGTGTEKIEQEIKTLFPDKRILRFDRDSVKNKRDLVSFYQRFESRDFDILVGTQLLAKGWDFDTVALIGVANADTALSFPDYKSNERTFQLITQVAGRAGRRNELGMVFFQTYLPENFAIQAALKHDYAAFYQKEIADRKTFLYPPFSHLIKCTVKHRRLEHALRSAEQLVGTLKTLKTGLEIIGPAPAFVPRLRGIYRVYVIIKTSSSDTGMPLSPELENALANLPAIWDIDVDPDSLL
ncbi:MAG: primosomal protein N' [Patescibacteria group bacterium]|nr:primosomal protein N' [Patescibacteria group bacterium]